MGTGQSSGMTRREFLQASGALMLAQTPLAKAEGFAALITAGGPQVQAVLDNAHGATVNLRQETGTIVLAQAETDGKVYTVYVHQVDANGNLTDKTVEVRYTKEDGTIIPPLVKNGKLLDGSPASGDVRKDERANRKILGKYDKDKQIILAMTGKDDVIKESGNTIRQIAQKIEKKQEITKDELTEAYVANYVFSQANFENEKERFQQVTDGLDKIAKVLLKLSPKEIEQMKQRAEKEAITRWRSVTRSLG